MTSLAVVLGRFIGAVLAECGPVLAEIIASAIKTAFTDTVEDGKRDDALRERLLARLRNRGVPVQDTCDHRPDRGAGSNQGGNQS